MPKRGIFIAIEGTDGSGKTTQFALLVAALKRAGHKVKTVDFPQYGKPSAYFVEQYLNGKFGGVKEVGPYQASLFYALDRYEAAPRMRAWLKQGYTIVANRYVLSSAGHQGSKLGTLPARKAFWKWLLNLEYETLRIPKPDTSILLHVRAEAAQQRALSDNKRKRGYLQGRRQDIHEGNLKHLRAAERSYLAFARVYDLQVIECEERGRLLTPGEVHRKVSTTIKQLIKNQT